jgi:hypothetical protein
VNIKTALCYHILVLITEGTYILQLLVHWHSLSMHVFTITLLVFFIPNVCLHIIPTVEYAVLLNLNEKILEFKLTLYHHNLLMWNTLHPWVLYFTVLSPSSTGTIVLILLGFRLCLMSAWIITRLVHICFLL